MRLRCECLSRSRRACSPLSRFVKFGRGIVLAWPKIQLQSSVPAGDAMAALPRKWVSGGLRLVAYASESTPTLPFDARAQDGVRPSMRLRCECLSRSVPPARRAYGSERRACSPFSRFVKFGRGIVFACPIFQRRRCCRCRGIRLRHLYQSRQMTTGAPCNAYFSA
jgi:hypothetical protein